MQQTILMQVTESIAATFLYTIILHYIGRSEIDAKQIQTNI